MFKREQLGRGRLIYIYYILTLSIGVFCLGCLFTTSLNNKNEAIRLYFLFYTTFSAFILVTGIRAFLKITSGMIMLENLLSMVQLLMVYSSLYLFACLINKVLLVPAARKINLLVLCLTLAAFALSVLDLFAFELGADEAFDGIMLIYYLGAYVRFRKNVINENLKKAMKYTFWSILLFVPGVVLDEITLSRGSNIHVAPILYVCAGIYSVLSFLKMSNSIQSNKFLMPENLIRRLGITDREAEVMGLLMKGYSYSRIADELVISISTVRTHVTNLYKKASVNSRYELYNLFE